MNKFKDSEGGALTLAMGQCVSVGVLSTIWLLSDFNFTFPNMGYMLDIHRVGAVLWTSVVTTVLAVWLQGIALKSVSAIEAALTFSTEPVWATIFSAVFLSESIAFESYVGGVVILAACLLSVASDGGGGGGGDV